MSPSNVRFPTSRDDKLRVGSLDLRVTTESPHRLRLPTKKKRTPRESFKGVRYGGEVA